MMYDIIVSIYINIYEVHKLYNIWYLFVLKYKKQ